MEEGGVVGGLPSNAYEEITPAAFIEKDYFDHRQVYIGLHHRSSGDKLRKKQPKLSITRPPKAFRWENGKKLVKHDDDSASEAEGPADQLTHNAPPSERVKFILGGDNEEEKQVIETPQLFTELEELYVHLDGNAEWKETARWYKYEEDVEEGGDRWSRPHVATLSLYSLFELRSSLMAGTVMLDMEATTLAEISDYVLDNLISCNKLDKGFRHRVRETLLCKHRHHRSAGFRRNLSNIISRKSFTNPAQTSANKLVRNVTHTGNLNEKNIVNGSTKVSTELTNQNQIKMFRNYSQPAFPALKTQPSFDRSESLPQGGGGGHLTYPSHTTQNGEEEDMEVKAPGFLKRLPSNAEASNVLVGELDFLEKPIAAFVRLAKSCVIGDLTEVPIPTRFVFVMLGPSVSQGRYHEIGRAISTLMADDIFHDVVYKAKCREDLIAGIDVFLEQVTVLPPGEWDPSIRLDPRQYHYSKSRRVAVEPKLETTMENSDKISEGNELSDSEKSHSIADSYKLCSGLLRDLKIWRNRKRDFKDGISMRCFGTGILVYFLLLAIVSTIGEHELISSGGLIGAREHMLAFLFIGILFSLFGGQPLLIIGTVIPLTLFDGFLYDVCQKYHLDFLSFRMLAGLWVVVILATFVVFDVSCYLRYFTRFSLEIFVVVPSLVLMGYGFVHMCNMIKAYSDLPGTFSNHTCLCVKLIREPINVTDLPKMDNNTDFLTNNLLDNLNSTLNTYNFTKLDTTINTTLSNSNSTNLLNTTISTTTTILSTTTLASTNILPTTSKPMYRIKEIIQPNVMFRDCVASKMMETRGEACMHGVFPFTFILTISSIVLVLFLTSFQHLGYLPKQVHQFLHNFTSLIVVIVLSLIANQFNINIKYINLPNSYVPDGIMRTTWFVHPLGANQGWTVILAIIPGGLLALLIFIEQQMCGRYINYQHSLLKKGNGYHLDLTVVCVGVFLSSILGLPFCVANIFLAVTNVLSLTVHGVDDFIGQDFKIKEQRMSSLLAFILVACTPAMTPMLKYIPFAVLYGLLIVALFKAFAGVQFAKRLTLLFMPKEKQPDIRYLRQVPLISVNIFTMSQVILAVVLCIFRATPAVLVFSFMVIVLIGMRLLLERVLPIRDILALDEPLPPFTFPWMYHRTKPKSQTIESIEKGALLADETHEDVLPDINKDLDRVNFSEELSKTAAWKQLTYAENNSPLTNNSPIDSTDGKKRRRKRSRTSGKSGKDSSPQGTMKSPHIPIENNELKEMNSRTEKNDDLHHLAPWMTKSIDEDDSPTKVHSTHASRQTEDDRTHSNHSRQRSKDRNSTKSSKGSKRHDSKKSHERNKERSHKPPKVTTFEDEAALPPWEQPYHSPPRKDFGLLHVPTEDSSIPDVDPACFATQSAESYSDKEMKTTLDDETMSPLVTFDRKQSEDSKGSILSQSPPHSAHCSDSGDASAELE